MKKRNYLLATCCFCSLFATAQNVGIGTTAPVARLHVADSAVLFARDTTALNTNANPPVQGAGVRMMWYPERAAFRVGAVDNGTMFGIPTFCPTCPNNWDRDNVGKFSFASGYNSKASGISSTAMGSSIASGFVSTAMGSSNAFSDYSIAMGFGTFATGNTATAIGLNTYAKAVGSLSAGVNNDITDVPDPYSHAATDRIFQIGNGNHLTAIRSNAITVLRNGNIGLGNMNSPNAPLQFGNGTANRKIVLFDVNNNDHEFFGFGLNAGELRFQINEAQPGVAHKFFAGLNSSTSQELMRIQGNGLVGIGSTNPVLGGLVVDKKAGATNAVFGSNTTGVAIESNFPGIGFNTYWNGGRKAIANGYGATIGTDPVNGGLGIHVTNNSYAAGTNVNLNPGITIKPNSNVGIGTTTANASLQLANIDANRRIVLWETANNDHQFYGFGINGFALRYQTPSTFDDHVFYTGINSSSSAELMRIKGNGMVRIAGQQSAGTGNKSLSIGGFGDIDVDRQGIAGGRFKILENGNAGIGNSTPNGELQFGNTPVNRKLVLWETANNDHQFYGLGINGGSLRYQVDNTTSAHKFYAGTSAATSNELLSINGNGNVSINGFTRLGESSPSIKTKLITGTTASTQGGSVAFQHGLSLSKILSVSVTVFNAFLVHHSDTMFPGNHFSYTADSFVIVIYNALLNSANILSMPVKILITYEE